MIFTITINYHPLATQHRAIYQPCKLTATSLNMIGAVLKMANPADAHPILVDLPSPITSLCEVPINNTNNR